MPLMPKRVKHRKAQRGCRKGVAQSGNTLSFGEYGLKGLDRAWIKAVRDCLRQRSKCAPPPMDLAKCRFGIWLNHEAKHHYEDHPAYLRVSSLHAQVHALGSELLALQADNQGEKALGRLDELYSLSDTLITELKRLITPDDSESNL